MTCNLCNIQYNLNTCNTCYIDTCEKCTRMCEYCKSTYCIMCQQEMINYCNVCEKIVDYNSCLSCIKKVNDYYKCDMCSKYTCSKCLDRTIMKYDEYNVSQWLTLCIHCKNNNMTYIKSQFMLLSNPQHNYIIFNNFKINYNIHKTIKTLLLIKNVKNKYISKSCFNYIIIPNIILNYIKKMKCTVKNVECTNYIKCISCLKYKQDVIYKCNKCYYFPFDKYHMCFECITMGGGFAYTSFNTLQPVYQYVCNLH